MNAAEDRLSELMDAATRALAPPIDTILAEGERLGRRRRRRRRAAVATGTAAVVLLGGVGVAAGLRYTHVDRDDVAVGGAVVAPHPSRAPTGAADPSPASPARQATPAASPTLQVPLIPITSAAAVQILRNSGLAGWKFGAFDPANASETSLLDFDVNDGKGVARVFVGIGSVKSPDMDPVDCALQAPLLKGGGNRPPKAPPPSCTERTYPNGDQVMQEVLTADAYGEYQYRVIAYRVDNVAVEITAANGDYANVDTEVTRTAPPLSMAQLTAIALQRAWQLKVPETLTFVTPSP